MTTTFGRSADAASAGAFARVGGAVLQQLVVRSVSDDVRAGLKTAVSCLQTGRVLMQAKAGRLCVNGTWLPPRPATTWLSLLGAAGVHEVEFAEDTSARELLLFLALLAAPGDAAAFAGTWLTSGSWRIHVSGVQESQWNSTAPPLPDVQSTSLPELCDAVARGEARTLESPVMQALRAHSAEATAALLQALARAENGVRRRLLFDAIVALREGAVHLITALQHDDWHVVRNAAALLGELKVERAASPLAALCTHPEYRVRIAVATSLGQLNSVSAREPLLSLVEDRHGLVRTRAWQAVASGSHAPPAVLLESALRREEDVEVQRSLLACAAAFPALDVSGGLIRFCAREFSRGAASDLIVFGVEQLALRRPASAKAFVTRLPQRLARAG